MKNSSQNGNVLFLILIAVALFAALSYAITQSGRSGGANASKETLQTTYSRLQTYVAGLRSTITRMSLNGADILDINFYPPSDFASLSAEQIATNVFHPNGGGYAYDGLEAVGDVNARPRFLFVNQIEGIGTTTSDWTGNEIMFALEVPNDFCIYVNTKGGYTGSIPVVLGYVDSALNGKFSMNEEGPTSYHMIANYDFPVSFSGKVEGCAMDSHNGITYYYVALIER